MPIFEYICRDCGITFEKLVSGGKSDVSCEKCNSRNVLKKFSVFGMSGVDKPASAGCSSCNSSSCKSCS